MFATHNGGKLAELEALAAPYGIDIISAADLNLSEPEETGTSFFENALLKARSAATASDLPALADDSGLSVDALGGAPGIYSARWAGEDKNFSRAMQRVHEALKERGSQDFTAHFITSLVLAFPDGVYESFEGRVTGRLVFPPRGAGGFGYDPIFIPEGETRTFAEMTLQEKQTLSHRARAFAQFAEACFVRAA